MNSGFSADNSNKENGAMMKSILIAMIMIGVAWWAPAAGAAEPSTQPATQPSTQPAKEIALDLGGGVAMKLVLIPAGKFIMGSPDYEKFPQSGEGPQRRVTIPEGQSPGTVLFCPVAPGATFPSTAARRAA